jgi:hypothetical protein
LSAAVGRPSLGESRHLPRPTRSITSAAVVRAVRREPPPASTAIVTFSSTLIE